MKNVRYFATVGTIALSAGLLATPLSAADASEDSDQVSLDARSSFEGFKIQALPSSISAPDISQLPDFSVQRSYEATPVPPTREIIARDDVGLEGSVDVDNTQPSVVQLFIQDNTTGGVFFNCTGTVINPRTILTAAHCLNSSSSEAYGLADVGDLSVLVASGVDTSVRVFEYLDFGSGYNEGGVATSTDVVIHPSANLDDGALPFPWADVAFVAVDEPITDVPAMPILLTPLTELTHVIQVGYGGFGTAETGDIGIGFLRRVGENTLGAQGSISDLIDTIFPDFAPTAEAGEVSQVYHFTDFDNPFRTPEEQAGCEFTGFNISCDSLAAVQAIDWFDGDALPNEVGTAGGDSGSPLIADQLGGPPVITAVLSGGFDFFGIGNTYSDISFYNPLFPFFEFITENTPYKYVSARRGFGRWSDPRHWTQDLDPGFLIDDGSGNLVNGVPGGSESGVYETGPKLGIVLGEDISGNADIISAALPPEGTPNFGSELPESSALLGPGSTGFVPNNTDGTPGVSFEAPAQYFDVLLNRFGSTLIDIDVEIDKLALDHRFASFRLPEDRTLTAIIGYEQFNGIARIDGQLNAGLTALFGGLTTGEGTIASDAVFNLGAGIAPGGLFGIGTMTIDGDYIQTSEGTLLANLRYNRRRGNSSDLLQVTGDASLAGNLIVTKSGRTRFGDEFTVLSANSILGEFDNTQLITFSPLLFAESRVEGSDVLVEINALRLRDLFSRTPNFRSLGAALDTLRFEGRFDQFAGLFDVVDGARASSLVPTLSSLMPTSGFNQSTLATNFSQRFTGQISQRTLSLRGGSKGAAGFSSLGGTGVGIAQTGPAPVGKLGFFSTVSGQFLVSAEERSTGASALEEAAFTQAGELTLGADMRVSPDVTIGVAVTSIRNSAANNGARSSNGDTSVSGSVYAAGQWGQGFVDAYVGFARQDFTLDRASQGDFAFAYESARGLANGSQTFGGVRTGYGMGILPGLEAGPVASLDYLRNDLSGFTEIGARSFGLNVQDRSFTSLGAKVGMMASLDTAVGQKGRLSAFGSVAYARELADSEDVITASFLGAPDVPFSIVNALDPEWVSVNAGVDLSLNRRLSIGVSGTSDLGRGPLTNNQGRVNVSWRF